MVHVGRDVETGSPTLVMENTVIPMLSLMYHCVKREYSSFGQRANVDLRFSPITIEFVDTLAEKSRMVAVCRARNHGEDVAPLVPRHRTLIFFSKPNLRLQPSVKRSYKTSLCRWLSRRQGSPSCCLRSEPTQRWPSWLRSSLRPLCG